MTSHERSSADTNWRAALEEYRAAKDRAAGAFRPDAKTCADLLARVAGVVRKGRSSPAGHDDATQRAAAAREIVDAPRGTWFLGADAAAQLRDARDAMRAERKLLDTAAKGAKS